MFMAHKNSNHDSDPAIPYPSVKEQESRLSTLLASNMRRILGDREFYDKVLSQYEVIFPDSGGPLNGSDMSVGVSSRRYGRRLDDGSWEEGESMSIGFKKPMDAARSVTNFVYIASRIDTPEGTRIVTGGPFTQNEAEMTAEMIDELMLAKASGQIPDLDEIGLSRIYIPQPHIDEPPFLN
jgi:hypothetical protein